MYDVLDILDISEVTEFTEFTEVTEDDKLKNEIINNEIYICSNCNHYIYPSDNDNSNGDDEDIPDFEINTYIQKKYGCILEYLCILCQDKLYSSVYFSYVKKIEEIKELNKCKNYFSN